MSHHILIAFSLFFGVVFNTPIPRSSAGEVDYEWLGKDRSELHDHLHFGIM
jgi:hypothetical protein